MRRENVKARYKVMFVKSKSTYTARVVIPSSAVADLGVRPGDMIEWSRVENGLLLRRVDNEDY